MRASLAMLALLLGCDVGPTPRDPGPTPQIPNGSLAPTDEPLDQLGVVSELIMRIDADGDGQISPTEHQRFALDEPAFQDLDLDASGALDAAEILAVIQSTDPDFTPSW